MIRFLEAVGVLLGVGACFALLGWMIVSSISEFWHGNDHEVARDRARPYTRDV